MAASISLETFQKSPLSFEPTEKLLTEAINKASHITEIDPSRITIRCFALSLTDSRNRPGAPRPSAAHELQMSFYYTIDGREFPRPFPINIEVTARSIGEYVKAKSQKK